MNPPSFYKSQYFFTFEVGFYGLFKNRSKRLFESQRKVCIAQNSAMLIRVSGPRDCREVFCQNILCGSGRAVVILAPENR